jgi:hypothetical protein
MNNKLLPCPFCGKKPKFSLGKIMYDQLHGEKYQDILLNCCIVRINTASKDRAIETWNNRAND